MQCDIKRELLRGQHLIPAEQPAGKDQVSGAGNRHEFGDALNNGENDCLIDWQGAYPVNCAANTNTSAPAMIR